LLEKPRELLAGDPYKAICEAKGSRPMAVISWWKDNLKMKRGMVSIHQLYQKCLTYDYY
jgi:hypothetical protein